MTDQDLKDIFAYLKTLTPVDHYVDNTLPPTQVREVRPLARRRREETRRRELAN